MKRLKTGQHTVSATAAQLTTEELEMVEYIVRCPTANAATVFIGDEDVTTSTGYGIEPGESVGFQVETREGQPRFEVAPSDVYVVGTNGDKVHWVGARHPLD